MNATLHHVTDASTLIFVYMFHVSNFILQLNILTSPLYISKRFIILQPPASLQPFVTIVKEIFSNYYCKLMGSHGMTSYDAYTWNVFCPTLKQCIHGPTMIANDRNM